MPGSLAVTPRSNYAATMKPVALLSLLLVLSACGGPAEGPVAPAKPVDAPADTQEATPAPAPTQTASAAPTAAAQAPEVVAPPPPKTFSLAEHKLPLSIDLPEGAKIEASTSRDGLGGVTVDAPKISLRIAKANAKLASIAAAKKTLQSLKFKPVTKFKKEEADLLVFERGEGDLGFLLLVKQGGGTYACQSLGGEASESALDPALAACRTLKKAP